MHLDNEAMEKVFADADSDNTGMIDKVKLGMFILRITGYQYLAGKRDV